MNKLALTAAAALLTTGLVSPVMAQSASAPAQIMVAAPKGHSVNKYYKQSVYTPAKEKIGTIDDVIASDDGQIQAFVIGVGGFLGMGEKNVAVPYRSVHAEFKDNAWYLTLNTTKDGLKAAPAMNFDKTKTAWVMASK